MADTTAKGVIEALKATQPQTAFADADPRDAPATSQGETLVVDSKGSYDYYSDDILVPPRKHKMPAIPDLRFEQSYLQSISKADTWWKVALITIRDQMLMPMLQGVVYNLLLCGWQHWNKSAQIHGTSLGARVRRWWYGVNNWVIPPVPVTRRRL
ncbi:hypothetical protein TD95_004893 [Thielaviopsis punctulata]|uniref:DUF1770 domain-containing protein n=1 Tax=Thielaviopsis punctulata TaxID=72032 RepID=A0A0F4Z8U4_9PEZI|nr:hypothetical protein TD95_004893 [Thielaviopsis punctulata]